MTAKCELSEWAAGPTTRRIGRNGESYEHRTARRTIVALIGFTGAVVGALINAYSAELKALVLGRLNRDKDLVGNWDCTWDIDIPERHPTIRDTVTIEKVSGETVRAVAHTPAVGKYRLVGRISQSNLLTFFYEGLDDRRPLGGVVILELNAIRNQMSGYWHEYGPDRVIIGGPTQWKKRSAFTA